MTYFRGMKFMAGPVMAAVLATPLFVGCSSEGKDLGGGCAADISAKADAFQASVDALVKVSGDMKASLYVACAKISTDLDAANAPDPAAKDVTDDELTAACDLATTAIADAKANVSGSLELIYVPPKCEVNASAQLNCEASCNVDAMCDPGSVEVRCDPGKLSGKCEGTCEGTVSCEGSATVKANCEGTCSAECTGTCSGTCKGTCEGTCNGACEGTCSTGDSANCQGTCDGTCTGQCDAKCTGQCDAKCTGSCSGSCELDANAMVMCNAEATCKGGCSVDYKEPKCEGELEPPSCMVDADCEAGCKGQAHFEATCTKPQVSVVATGNAELTATLEANMPAIFQVGAQAELVLQAAGDVASRAGAVGSEVIGSLSCAADYGAGFVAELQASVEASASVSVSVQASASVSGEASSG